MTSANITAQRRPLPSGPALRLWQSGLHWKILSVAKFALIWEFAARLGFNFAFPTFTATMAALWSMIADGSRGATYLRTMKPLVIGLVISLTVGISAGVAMGLRQTVEWITLPVFIVMQAAPMAALIPLVTFVHGTGLTSKVLAVVMLSMPVIAMNRYKAVRNVPSSMVAMRASYAGVTH